MDIFTALQGLERLRTGEIELDEGQLGELIDSVRGCVAALANYPRSGDRTAVGMWFNRERAPALARLTDAVTPDRPGASAVQELRWAQEDERTAARSLHLRLHGTLSADGRTTWAEAAGASSRNGGSPTSGGPSSHGESPSPGGSLSPGGSRSPGGLTRDKKPKGSAKSAHRRSLYYGR